MENRAILKPVDSNIGVYLHWNGGVDSVTAFLKYCEMKGHRNFNDAYGMARFCQVVGNYFGGSLSIGIDDVSRYPLDSLDNGVYVIDGWKIVKRIGNITPSEGYELTKMLCSIDECQPVAEQLTKGFITAKEVPPEELKIGDKVYFQDHDGKVSLQTVIGFGAEGKWCNGNDVSGVPYTARYKNNPEDNINNYIRETVRVKTE